MYISSTTQRQLCIVATRFPGFFVPAKFVTSSTAPVVEKYCLSEITVWVSKNYVRHKFFLFYTGQKSLDNQNENFRCGVQSRTLLLLYVVCKMYQWTSKDDCLDLISSRSICILSNLCQQLCSVYKKDAALFQLRTDPHTYDKYR